MKKTILILCAAMFCTVAGAQVTRGTVGNGSYTDYAGTTSTRNGLDFNNDGVCEFALNTGYDNEGSEIENGAVEYVFSSTNNVHTDADMWDYFSLMNEGDAVNVASGFNGQGDCFFEDYSAIGSCAYVGFRINAGGMCYGYAKVSLSGNAVHWDEIYYNATPSAAITVGDRGEAGISEAEVNHFIAAAMDSHQLNIVQEGNDVINVYDVKGVRVASVRGNNNTVTLPQSGMYFLCSTTSSAKIFVK